MKKKFLFLVFNFLFLSAAFCEEFSFDEICSGLVKNEITCGSFTQEKKSASLKRPLKSSGKYLITKEGVCWKTEKPFNTILSVTENYIVQIDSYGNKNITDGSSNEVFGCIAETLSSLFKGSREKLEQNFTVDFSCKDKIWTMVLEPKDKTISLILKNIFLEGTAENQGEAVFVQLEKMKVVQENDDLIEYEFANQIYKKELSDEEKEWFSKN